MTRRVAANRVLAIAASGALLAGCGGSSKPGYCSDVTNFKNAVKDLGNVNVIQGGTSAITSAIQKVESTGKAAVASAKSDFPSQTSAVDSSLTALDTTVKQLSNPQTQKTALTQLPAQITATGKAIDSFVSATNSKCG